MTDYGSQDLFGGSAAGQPGAASVPGYADQGFAGQSTQPPLAGGQPGQALPAPPVAPSLNVPTGGGAIRGIGEKFSVGSSTGTATLSLPLPASPGRGGSAPDLSLRYDSGSGNGIFGFGWQLSLPAITRKTDKGIPRYDDSDSFQDAAESDVFILSGSEDLVPVLGDGRRPGVRIQRAGGHAFAVKAYRPRVEGQFARIERWTAVADGQTHWRTITRDNITSLFGTSDATRISDPSPDLDAPRVFSWLLAETFDDKGNHVSYGYRAEDGAGVDERLLHEANRPPHARRANRYLKSVRYANRFSRLSPPASNPCDQQSWLLEVVLDYGDHDDDEPTARPSRQWAVRTDPFSTYRAGFEIRTYRLCQRILMFHHFPDEPGVGADCVVRSLDLRYTPAPYSFLTAITSRGWRRRPAGGYLTQDMAPLELSYSAAVIDDTVRTVDPGSAHNLPAGVSGPSERWIDLDGEGIPGVLSDIAGWWSYKENLGRGRLAPSRPVSTEPTIATQVGRQEFLDLAASGRQDLVQLGSGAPGYHERTIDGGWGDFRTFPSLPQIAWDDPDLQFADLTGDGLADIVITGDDAIIWHASLGRTGFGQAYRTGVPVDDIDGPRQVFANGEQTLFLADISGDGLADLVRIRNGDVAYWPSLGYGRFGRRIEMDEPPLFDTPEAFDASRIRLADVDGSGTTDIIYLGPSHAAVCLNDCGNRWLAPRLIDTLPLVTDLSTATVTDILGTGTACIVWSSPLPADTGRALRYLDLNGGVKPHLLTRIANNLGAETRIGYAPSTRFLLADKAAGVPWATTLPFCVHVVETVECWDWIGRTRCRSRYAYHHGYFDGVEREFRGFGLVEHIDSEEFAALAPPGAEGLPAAANISSAGFLPPTVSTIWYHTGAPPWELRRLPGAAGRRGGDRALADARELERMLRENVTIPAGLAPADQREAYRSLQGSLLRQDVRALDGSPLQANPYTVTEQTYQVRCYQPVGLGRHGVFFSHPTQTLTTTDERDPADPLVTQALTLEVDDFGSIVASAVVSYGRRHQREAPAGHPGIVAAQRENLITYSRVSYTNEIATADDWRAPVPAETRTWEITGLAAPPGRLLSPAEVAAAATRAEPVGYTARPRPGLRRRLFDHRRTVYLRDDLNGTLPPGRAGRLALVDRTLQLALTADVIEQAYGPRVTDSVLRDEGGYREAESDEGAAWWAPSGTVSYAGEELPPPAELEEARRHFFMPRRFTDPFGNTAEVRYDAYDLALLETRDPLGNVTSAGERDPADRLTEVTFDYRVLQPAMIMDANRNRSSVRYDALGLVAAAAVAGKPGERVGDSLHGVEADLSPAEVASYLADPVAHGARLLGDATQRFVYDLGAFQRTRSLPAVAAGIARQTHVSDLRPGEHSRLQHVLVYSDGYGRDVQRKGLAEPGPLTEDGPVSHDRWVTTGWTVFNNKGLAVRQYEPFFTGGPGFEFAVTAGVSAILIYDPLGRVIATINPDHSWEKVVFGTWQQRAWDRNDTVLDRPDQDPDIGGFVTSLPPGDYLPTWYERRAGGELGPVQSETAAKAARHARTPAVTCFDALGRTTAAIVHNRVPENGGVTDVRYVTTSTFDIQGNMTTVTDALGRQMLDQQYGLLAVPIRSCSPDQGERRALHDATGQPLRSWDSRGFTARQRYDALRRPTGLEVAQHGGRAWLAEVMSYGEDAPDAAERNLRGIPWAQRDSSGLSVTERCDFKGNVTAAAQRLVRGYHQEADWFADPALEDETYRRSATFDALNLPVSVTAPDGSVTRRSYNQRSLLRAVTVQPGQHAPAEGVVDDIQYDAKGQRTRARYSNGAVIRNAYDPQTFRLIRTRALRRPAGHQRPSRKLQDLRYDYDPIGNVTHVADRAQQTIFFANQVVSPASGYTYDATYRLVEATGREHSGQPGRARGGPDGTDLPAGPLPGDGAAMRRYREQYQYNAVGNIVRLVHRARGGSWTRKFRYGDPGSPSPNNQLTSTMTGKDEARYGYDASGNMIAMPHLADVTWDWRDQLRSTAKRAGGHAGLVTYYAGDATGSRVRKVTDGEHGTRRTERVYLGSYEIYREFSVTGEVTVERQDLSVSDGAQVACRIESTIRHPEHARGAPPARLHRYQLTNYLGSACVEIDSHAAMITYEEYYPWGSSSWRAGRSQAETGLKRYRFAGKERDDETGLYYFGSRYYVPWIGRWTAPDPSGLSDGTDVYAYARDNPVSLADPSGADTTDPDQTTGTTEENLDAGAPDQQTQQDTENLDAGAPKPLPDPDYVNEAGEAIYLMPADQAQSEHAELQEGGAAPQELAEQGIVPTVSNQEVRDYIHQEVVTGAKAAVRHDPILGPAVVLAGIVTYQFDKKAGQAMISAIDGPEPESDVAQASEQYTAAAIGIVETLVGEGLGALSGPKAPANPFSFMEDLGEMGGTLQGQVDAVAETLKPFQGLSHEGLHVPPESATQIGGATTVVGGQQRTIVTFSNEGSHRVFSEGFAELPPGVGLGPQPRPTGGRFGPLPKQSHVERAAVNSLRARYGAQGGLVTTSGNACPKCAAVWTRGKAYPTWIHMKWKLY